MIKLSSKEANVVEISDNSPKQNVVQEKINDGDFEYKVAGKLRKARQIKNFKQDQKINKELFELALEYVN